MLVNKTDHSTERIFVGKLKRNFLCFPTWVWTQSQRTRGKGWTCVEVCNNVLFLLQLHPLIVNILVFFPARAKQDFFYKFWLYFVYFLTQLQMMNLIIQSQQIQIGTQAVPYTNHQSQYPLNHFTLTAQIPIVLHVDQKKYVI